MGSAAFWALGLGVVVGTSGFACAGIKTKVVNSEDNGSNVTSLLRSNLMPT